MSARGAIATFLNDLCLQSRKMAGWAGASWYVSDVSPDRLVIARQQRKVEMTAHRLSNIGETIANRVGPLPFERLVCETIEVPAPAPPFPNNSFEPAASMLARLLERAHEDGWAAHVSHPHDELLKTMSSWAGDRLTHVEVVDADPEEVKVQVIPELSAYGGVAEHADHPAMRVESMLDFLAERPRIRVAVMDHKLHGWVVWEWSRRGRSPEAPPEGSVAWLQQSHRQRVFGDLWRACEAVGWTRGEAAKPLPESAF